MGGDRGGTAAVKQNVIQAASSPLTGIALKVISVAIFVGMSTAIKLAGQVPAGQIVFYRSFFAIFPILVFLAFRGELRTAVVTKRPGGHIMRGLAGVTAMGFGFFALTQLPLPEAITLNYAQPLLVVVFSALILGENVRAYRWTAVAVGLVGVLIVSWPNLTLFTSPEGVSDKAAMGAVSAIIGAGLSAIAMLLVRNLVHTERTATIVLWFSLTASVMALFSIPFGWQSLSWQQTALLVSGGFCGGIAQLFMTEAYRHAEASTVAPFEYTSLLLGIAVGYLVFGDLPTIHTLVGGIIVIAAGIFIIWREQRLGLERQADKKASSPQ
nr:DMT family transporter [Aminobacter sp. MDW-2]